MPPLNHWSRFAVPRLWAGAAVALGLLMLVLFRIILTGLAGIGSVLGLVLIVGGGFTLLVLSIKDPRFPG